MTSLEDAALRWLEKDLENSLLYGNPHGPVHRPTPRGIMTTLPLCLPMSDWTRCPHCHQSMSASYGGKLRCIRCDNQGSAIFGHRSTVTAQKINKANPGFIHPKVVKGSP